MYFIFTNTYSGGSLQSFNSFDEALEEYKRLENRSFLKVALISGLVIREVSKEGK